MSNKTLVWLDPELAARVEHIDSIGGLDEIVGEYITKQREDIEQNLQSLDEYALWYQGAASRARIAFSKSLNESLDISEKLFKSFDTAMNEKDVDIEEKAKSLSAKLDPMVEKLQSVETMLENLDFRQIERALELAERLSNVDPKTLDILVRISGEE